MSPRLGGKIEPWRSEPLPAVELIPKVLAEREIAFEEKFMTKKFSWPSLLFVLYVVAVITMGAIALSKTGPF